MMLIRLTRFDSLTLALPLSNWREPAGFCIWRFWSCFLGCSSSKRTGLSIWWADSRCETANRSRVSQATTDLDATKLDNFDKSGLLEPTEISWSYFFPDFTHPNPGARGPEWENLSERFSKWSLPVSLLGCDGLWGLFGKPEAAPLWRLNCSDWLLGFELLCLLCFKVRVLLDNQTVSESYRLTTQV